MSDTGQWLTALRSAASGPRPELALEYVRQAAAELLRFPAGRLPSAEQSLNELGCDSMTAAELRNRFEMDLDVNLSADQFAGVSTIAELAGILAPLLTAAPSRLQPDQRATPGPENSTMDPVLVPLQPYGERLPFFCIHAEGGGVLMYRDLARLLGSDQPVYGLQAEAAKDPGSPYESCEEMAARYVRVVRSVQPHGPYFLGGACLGGNLAFEMAQQLRLQGETTGIIAMIDGLSPYPRKTLGFFLRRADLMLSPLEATRYLASWAGRRVKAEWATRTLWTVGHTSTPLLKMDATQKRMREVYRNYKPRRYQGRITYFVNEERARLPYWRWDEFAADGVELHVLPGDHAHMLFHDVKPLAEKLSACLERAQTR